METRRIYKTGAKDSQSFAIVLPKEWARSVYDNPLLKGSVKVAIYGDKVLVLPGTDKTAASVKLVHPRDEVPKQFMDSWIESTILNSYFSNIDRVEIVGDINEEKTSNRIEELRRKLSGFKVEERTSNKLTVSFDSSFKPIHEILERSFSLLYGVNEENRVLLRAFPDVEGLLARARRTIESNENDADQNAMLGKRLLNGAMVDPQISEKLGIKNTHDIIEYHTILVSLERLSDLEGELFSMIEKLWQKAQGRTGPLNNLRFERKPEKYPFATYLDSIFDMVRDAWKARDQAESALESALKVISTKGVKSPDGTYYRPGYVSADQRTEILTYTNERAEFPEELIPMEGKIWGMSGISTNIAEAWLNMKAS